MSTSRQWRRGFGPLWASQFISQIGDRLAMVAFPWLVYSTTHSELGTAFVLALYTLPYVIWGALAGVVVDRVDKRRLMVAADVIRAALVALVPLAASRSLVIVYLLSFATASIGAFFEPAKLAIIPEIVPRRSILRANSLLTTGDNVTEVAGYLIAGAIVAVLSVSKAFFIDAGTYLLSAAALCAIRYHRPACVAKPHARLGAQLREGWSFVLSHRGLLANTAVVFVAAGGVGATYSLTFLLAVRVMRGGPAAFGIFEAAIGGGFLLGSIVTAFIAQRFRKGLAMTIGVIAMGVVTCGVALAPTVAWAAVPFFVVGVINSAVMLAIDTYVQQTVPIELAGRVWGSRVALTQGAYAAGVLGGGALAAHADVRLLFVAAGVIIAIAGVGASFVRELREA